MNAAQPGRPGEERARQVPHRGTVFQLFFGTDRIHGRFTQLHIPGGPTYPICMVLVDRSDRLGVGGKQVKPGDKPGTALISWSEGLIPVERFE